jgi:glucokinase
VPPSPKRAVCGRDVNWGSFAGAGAKGRDRLGGRRIIGDIGGTNARFAIAEGGKYRELAHVEVSRFGSLHDALTDYLSGQPPVLRSGLDGALAVAGPVLGDQVTLTNLGWSFSIDELQRSLGLGSLKVINDFAATAMAVPHLPGADVFPVGPKTPAGAGPIGIIGPGTGLGVSALIPDGRRWLMVAGEGGHVTLASASREEDAIIEVLRKRWSHVSAERVLSGAGLVNLYEALSTINGFPARTLTPSEVTRYAMDGTDRQCVAAFSHFCAFLGSAAGDLALTFGASGGIYIAGGILLRFKEALASSSFRERFEQKGRFAAMLAKIPTSLILEESPALLGLAHLPLAD